MGFVDWFIKLLRCRFHADRTFHAKDFRCHLLAIHNVVESGTPRLDQDAGSGALVVWE